LKTTRTVILVRFEGATLARLLEEKSVQSRLWMLRNYQTFLNLGPGLLFLRLGLDFLAITD
jgi:hypothetical protein